MVKHHRHDFILTFHGSVRPFAQTLENVLSEKVACRFDEKSSKNPAIKFPLLVILLVAIKEKEISGPFERLDDFKFLDLRFNFVYYYTILSLK